ncbi:MAG: transposase [Verrucomicrobiales bacterium]|nr:transposase [Verrucomicrobiales bacterium]
MWIFETQEWTVFTLHFSGCFEQSRSNRLYVMALAKEGVMIDASFVEVPQSLQDNAKVRAHKDLDAHWTKKNRETHQSYKDHVQVDVKDKLILKAVITPASTDMTANRWTHSSKEATASCMPTRPTAERPLKAAGRQES